MTNRVQFYPQPSNPLPIHIQFVEAHHLFVDVIRLSSLNLNIYWHGKTAPGTDQKPTASPVSQFHCNFKFFFFFYFYLKFQDAPIRAEIGQACWINAPFSMANGQAYTNQPITCRDGLVCLSCPEMAPHMVEPSAVSGMPLPGFCVNMTPLISKFCSFFLSFQKIKLKINL